MAGLLGRRRLSPAGSGVDSITWSVRSVWSGSELLYVPGPSAAGSGVASLRWLVSLSYSPKRER